MEKYLKDFEVPPKNPSIDALRRWRKLLFLVKNRKRRFQYTADLSKRSEAEEKKQKIKEARQKLRILVYVQTAAHTFVDSIKAVEMPLQKEVIEAGFSINPSSLESLVRDHNLSNLKAIGGVEGVARKVSVSLNDGVMESEVTRRQQIYGYNRYVEKPPKGFWTFVWEALQDVTLIILMVCAVVSIGVGLSTEGWPKGMYDGLGIILSIFLVVTVTAISDYRQSLQFRALDREKKKIMVQVTRDGSRKKLSIYDLVVGDIVHLSIGDQVPADGLFISGYSLLIDESSLSGESEPVNVHQEKPFLLSGTKVQDGSGKMLVTGVGMRTEWGRLMETLSQGGEDETPLQVKLNGVATIIGKIGLAFSVLTFLVLVVRLLVEKAINGEFLKWSANDALKILNYFATAVTIIVVAIPEGLPLAVTLSLAFAMKKLMSDMALVRHLSACETMGSASCICTDKTGTLTTNHMVVDKVWFCQETKLVRSSNAGDYLRSSMPKNVLDVILQCVFQNTGSEVVKEKNGKTTILGTPTESAILEFGLHLGGDFDAQRQASTIVKVEPFNSNRKKMSVVVSLQGGGFRAFSKGASEIIVRMCEKVLDRNGASVPLSKEREKLVMDVINGFACDALRTIALAFKDISDDCNGKDIPSEGYTLIAVVGIKDPVRPGVMEAVQSCMDAGIIVRMVTGDNINTAKAIAKECGILREGDLAIEGPDFRCKTPQEMDDLIPKLRVMARSLPLDKHTLVTHLRKSGEVVAVTGDGTNDAPALHEADIGLAMGIAGTEVAKENADVIIMDDNFTTIVNVAKWGRAVYINIQKFVQFQLTVNVVALIINFVSACIIGSAPLTAVQLLWVNMIMDTLGALALATEPPNDELLKRPPVGRTANFITGAMWRNILGQSIYQLLVLGLLMFDGKKLLKLHGSDATNVLNTFIFNSFVFCQVFNEINSRDIERINILRGLFSSWIFLGIISVTVVFQVIIIEFLGAFASTVPLSWQLWLISVLIGSVSLIIGVFLKCIPVNFIKQRPAENYHSDYQPLPSGPELA